MLPMRRNHIAVVLNTDLVIHGGCDENGMMHQEVYSLCLKSFLWDGPLSIELQRPKISMPFNFGKSNKAKLDERSLEYKINNLKSSPLIVDGSPGKVSHHAGCLVVYKNSKATKPVSLYDRDSQRPPPPEVMQYEGIYIFGGKDTQGEVMGNLYVLTVGKRPLNWINLQKYIDNESPSPCPRFGHCMHYSPELNFVVLFGGRNDSLGQAEKSIFNDIWILKLNVLNWVNIK